MIIEQAPSFGAAGAFLAAPYTLDFSKDLSHMIPIEGTWQGDRKMGKSLYIDNYSNNVSITVSSGNYSIRIPAYTSAYINLAGFNDVFISSDGASVNTARLSTEDKATEMISRGNAPATSSVTPFSFIGSVNLTTSSTGTSNATSSVTVYCPDNNCVYIYAQNGNLIIFDCAANKIKSVIVPRGGSFAYSGVYSLGKIYFGLNNSGLLILTVADNSCVFRDLSIAGAGSMVDDVCVHENENSLYYKLTTAKGAASYVYYIPLDFSAAQKAVTVSGGAQARQGYVLFYSKSKGAAYDLYSDNTVGICLDSLSKGVAVQSAIAIPVTALSGIPSSFVYDGADNIYVAYTTANVYSVNITAMTWFNTNNMTNSIAIAIRKSSLYSTILTNEVYDIVLKGIIANMPAATILTMTYCPVNDYVYFLCADGSLKWGN